MIIPSIDLMDGNAVQLVGGDEKHKAIDGGDPRPLAQRFGRAAEVAVIDLDAAMGKGDNTGAITDLLGCCRARVGGGIRSVERARHWLDLGAEQVIIGTAAEVPLLSKLPRERVTVALDARDGEVQVEGWKRGTGARIVERMRELRDHCGAFLVTFIENEGRMEGTQLERVAELVEEAGPARLTIAGGVTTVEEIAQLDRMGVDAQVGMALYSGRLNYADAFLAPMKTDRADGLWPTVVVDERGVAIGLVYSSRDSVRRAIEDGRGVYYSRSRQGLWAKGETSGATQELIRLDVDCDRDALRFTVRQQAPGFCHLERRTCWGEESGIGALWRQVESRRSEAPSGSYTRRLFEEESLLGKKLLEEAGELVAAQERADVTWEAADVLYFTLVKMAAAGIDLEDVEKELARRARRVTRRGGDAKS
ncbi:MAG: phosphoribosyl-ATP diphosphatase [Myxococcota bacterium]